MILRRLFLHMLNVGGPLFLPQGFLGFLSVPLKEGPKTPKKIGGTRGVGQKPSKQLLYTYILLILLYLLGGGFCPNLWKKTGQKPGQKPKTQGSVPDKNPFLSIGSDKNPGA